MAAAVASRPLSLGPFLWGPGTDLAVFGGTAAGALALVALGHALGLHEAGEAPAWVWLVGVLFVDVAHVYSTLFRTYLDPAELAARPVRYVTVPIACYLGGVALHTVGGWLFWTVLAYGAVFHFVRQQVGWVAVYRARAGQRGALDRCLDEGAIYGATVYPLVYWHAHLAEARFVWLKEGDFVDVARTAAAIEPWAAALALGALAAFAVRSAVLALRGTLQLGKIVVVASTAVTWYVGIVATNSDFDFTVTNVLTHGVPYLVLLYFYARERRADAPGALGSRIIAGGVGAFIALLAALAFLEELAWDQLVWHDRPWLFGESPVALGEVAVTLVVPLLAVPQLTHYVLDGFVWRRPDSQRLRAQRAAIGLP